MDDPNGLTWSRFFTLTPALWFARVESCIYSWLKIALNTDRTIFKRRFLQLWLGADCDASAHFLPADHSRATNLINQNLLSILNALEYPTLFGVVDGVIVWPSASYR